MQGKSKKEQTIKSIILGVYWGVYFGFAIVLGTIAITYYTRDWVIPKHF